MKYRTEQIATAFAIAAVGMAVGVSIIVRTVCEAWDTATTWDEPNDVCPDCIPDALLVDR